MTTPTNALNNSELAALRMADTVNFHVTDGRAFIRAHRHAPSGIYTAREQHIFPTAQEYGGRFREIPCDIRAMGYGYNDSIGIEWTTENTDAPKLAAFASVSGTLYGDNTWPTTAQALRVGDRLCLSWTADNNNTTIREANLHSDRLTLRVTRGEKKPRHLAFFVAQTVTHNNSARMIRRDGYGYGRA
jgi:hypothetical protein